MLYIYTRFEIRLSIYRTASAQTMLKISLVKAGGYKKYLAVSDKVQGALSARA